MIYFVFLDTLGIRSFQGSLTLTVFRIRQSIPDPGYKKTPGSGIQIRFFRGLDPDPEKIHRI